MKTLSNFPLHQRGVTLIELMVGMAVGLLVVAIAMGALLLSRGISGTVSDASSIQQQGAYAMRLIGMQLRQAGSLEIALKPDPSGAAAVDDPITPVEFIIKADGQGGGNNFNRDNAIAAVDELDSGSVNQNTRFVTTFSRYRDKVYSDAAPVTLTRNCMGGPADSGTKFDAAIKSKFFLDGSVLKCSGNDETAQPVVQNVAQFEVSYLRQGTGANGTSTIQYVQADEINDWGQVQGVQICLILYGTETIDLPAGSTYTDCEGDEVGMSALAGERKNRMHIRFLNVFQLRSQGQIDSST